VPEDLGRDVVVAEQCRAWTRALTSIAIAGLRKQAAETFTKAAWPNDTQALTLTKAAVDPLSTATGTALMPTITGAFLSGIAPQSAAVQLFRHALQLDFSNVHQFFFPRGSLTPQPIFIGEGQPMPMVKLTTTGTIVGPIKKIMIGSAVTSQLEDATPEAASAIVGNALSEAVAGSLDATAFDNVASDDVRPAGLLHDVAPLAPTSGGGLNAMTSDLANLAGAISDAKIGGSDLVVIANPRQAIKLKLMAGPSFDYLILSTSALAPGSVVLISPAALAVGSQGVPELTASKHAIAHFEDTAPMPISANGTIAAPVLSAWQTDLLLLRVKLNATWAVLQPGAIQHMANCTW
jgi:hypothetical protein